MKKKILFILAMVAMLVCLFAISASAVTVDGIEYSLSGNNATVGDNRGYTGANFIVPSTIKCDDKTYTVTATASYMLDSNSSVEVIYLPSTITKINDRTISQMKNLKAVYIDFANITSVGECGLTSNNQKGGSNIINTSFVPLFCDCLFAIF